MGREQLVGPQLGGPQLGRQQLVGPQLVGSQLGRQLGRLTAPPPDHRPTGPLTPSPTRRLQEPR